MVDREGYPPTNCMFTPEAFLEIGFSPWKRAI